MGKTTRSNEKNERIEYNLPTISNVKMEIKGDGTVPYYSLVMGGALENLESSRFAKFNTSHTGIVGCVKNKDTFMELGKCPESDVIKWVLNILGKNEKYNVNSAKVENKKYTVIRIACPVDVKVESNGEVLDSSKNSFNDRTSFGSIELLGKKGDIKIVTLYDGIDFKYNVELKGTDNGFMDYEISYFDEDENEIDRKELINVPVTIGMNAYSNTNSENIIIEIDYNGDVKYEYSLKEGDHKDLANKIIA